MKKSNNLFLVGPMGAGKTSVGKQLAKLTGMPFYDSDAEIARRTGVSISWIFEKEKEAGFRAREMDIIDQLTSLDNIVLSTGGGSVVTPENCDNLIARGTVIYLNVSLDTQLTRTKRTDTRPLLENIDNPEAMLLALNAQREPLYQRIAQLSYLTDNMLPETIANQILIDIKWLR